MFFGNLTQPSEINAVKEAARGAGESHFCAVQAVSMALGKDFMEVRRMFKHYGRPHRAATPRPITRKVLRHYGYRMIKVDEPRKMVHTLFNGFDEKEVYLIATADHLMCYKNGNLYDEARNRYAEAIEVFKLRRV